jgi:hypothetical protein
VADSFSGLIYNREIIASILGDNRDNERKALGRSVYLDIDIDRGNTHRLGSKKRGVLFGNATTVLSLLGLMYGRSFRLF